MMQDTRAWRPAVRSLPPCAAGTELRLRRRKAAGSLIGRLAGAGLLVLLGATAGADRVEWSDGRVTEGTLRLPDEQGVRFHDGKRLQTWPAGQIAAISWAPATQHMDRAWRFLEAGQTAKVYDGEPYPVIELGSRVALRDGREESGHLLTTVFYLESGPDTRKLVARQRLQGKPGESYTNLVYPARLVWTAASGAGDASAAGAASAWTVTVARASAPLPEPAVVFRRPVTVAAELRRVGAGRWTFPADGSDPVLALREGTRIRVGWTGGADAAMTSRVAQAAADERDFFDRRDMVAVATNAADAETVYSLMLAWRAGATTFGAEKSQPWRLEVWRWRLAADGQNQLAVRAVLHRGIRARDEALPEIRLDPALAPPARPGEWMVPGAEP